MARKTKQAAQPKALPRPKASRMCLSATVGPTARPRRGGSIARSSAPLAQTAFSWTRRRFEFRRNGRTPSSHGLQQATHVIAVIGPQWLRVTDDYGRRRIDRDDDWVQARDLPTRLQQRQTNPAHRANHDRGVESGGEFPSDIQRLGERSSRSSYGMTDGSRTWTCCCGELEQAGIRAGDDRGRAVSDACRCP